MRIAFLHYSEVIASTVSDHISAFQKYSQNEINYFDVRTETITYDMLKKFDAVIVHYTVAIFYDPRCPPWLRLILRRIPGKKIVFIQDEYRVVNDVIENLNFIKADLLFTCVPDHEIENVYATSRLPRLMKVNNLTGYVPEDLLKLTPKTYEERELDVVYRARRISMQYGSLGQEKWQIAEKFNADAPKYKLKTDISYREEDRIYGQGWTDFLMNTKAALGAESGASVFDFTGEIQRNVEAYERVNPNAVFEDVEEKFFKGLDGKIYMNQISPRAFECAALGTLMVLYEGRYSGVLEPWRHYVPLKKDHSNMDEVVEAIKSKEKWTEITSNARKEVALNEKYSYKVFIQNFDTEVEKLFAEAA